MRRAPLPHLCALLAGAAAALAVGCGDRSHLVPAGEAQNLKDRLAAVQQAVDAGKCDEAMQAVDRASETAQNLDATEMDRRLRRRILDGIQQLRKTVPRDCEAQTETVDTTTTETVATDTVTTETTTTTDTVATTTTTTTAPDTTTAPTTTATPTTTTSQPQTTPDSGSPDTGGTQDVPTP